MNKNKIEINGTKKVNMKELNPSYSKQQKQNNVLDIKPSLLEEMINKDILKGILHIPENELKLADDSLNNKISLAIENLDDINNLEFLIKFFKAYCESKIESLKFDTQIRIKAFNNKNLNDCEKFYYQGFLQKNPDINVLQIINQIETIERIAVSYFDKQKNKIKKQT